MLSFSEPGILTPKQHVVTAFDNPQNNRFSMSGISSKVGPDGQLVIPVEIVNSLDWMPGADVSLSIEDNRLVARKSIPKSVPFFYALAMKSLEEMRRRKLERKEQALNS
jgi:bifunctional DNA-binding transcriptional regulator/antitoxin component of YhaV-PrlF toxin-antitoxin module